MPRRATPNPLGQAIGLRIKQLRTEQGMTAEKLAYESEVGSKGFVSDIEHGLALPSLLTLDRIAQRLDVSLFDLLVVPGRSDRELLVEVTRRLRPAALARLLRELGGSQPVASDPERSPLHRIRAYATLEVAAGWSSPALPRAELGADFVRLPGKFNRSRDFAVRASGHSMQGFRSSIRHGDWLVMRKAQLTPAAATGSVVLVCREDRFGDKSLHLKRVVQTGRRLWFRSDDPAVKPMLATEADRILATLVSVVAPAALAPALQTRFAKAVFPAVFGLTETPTARWSRVDGHLFFVLRHGDITPSGLLTGETLQPRPAETAYVLLGDGDWYEYLGLARWDIAREAWQLREASKSE
jgi:transcriptional regulator with XRE-family HTH domain